MSCVSRDRLLGHHRHLRVAPRACMVCWDEQSRARRVVPNTSARTRRTSRIARLTRYADVSCHARRPPTWAAAAWFRKTCRR